MENHSKKVDENNHNNTNGGKCHLKEPYNKLNKIIDTKLTGKKRTHKATFNDQKDILFEVR